MLVQETVAQATAVVGYNIAAGKFWQTAGVPRVISAIALTGSAAAGDCSVDIYYGTYKIAQIRNTATGAGNNQNMFNLSNVRPCLPGEPINVYVTTQPTTNPIFFYADIQGA